MRLIILFTFILKTFIPLEFSVIGTYKSSLGLPRHPTELTLKLKKNKKYRIESLATTVHAKTKETGIFEIRNDSIILYPIKYQTEKHIVNNYQKKRFICNNMRDFKPCHRNILLIRNNKSSTTILIDKRGEIEWILENE